MFNLIKRFMEKKQRKYCLVEDFMADFVHKDVEMVQNSLSRIWMICKSKKVQNFN